MPGTEVEPTSSLNLLLKVNDLKYFKIYGYLGQNTLLNVSDSLNISFLNHSLANNIQWADPQLTFTVRNSYGLPIEFNIDAMSINSIINKKTYPVSFYNNSNVLQILSASQNGNPSDDSLVFNPSTTNFFSYLQQAPNTIKFHLSSKSNPAGNSGPINFMADTSQVDPNLRLYLPIWFKAGNFGTVDTIKSPFSDLLNQNGKNKNSIESMLFRIISENTLPVDINLQIIFADSIYKPLDSLYKTGSSKIVIGGQLNAGDVVTTPTKSTTNISLNATNNAKQLNNLKKTKYLLVTINMATSDYNKGVYAKFLNSYYVKLSFDCQFQLKIQQTNK